MLVNNLFYFIERKPSKFRYLNTVTISLKPALLKVEDCLEN